MSNKTQTDSRQTPLAVYQRRIAAGELRADRAQNAALKRLTTLYCALAFNQSSWWARLRRAKLRGMYLCGGVGGGKTMLMDLFFDSLPHNLGERIHFHKFMQGVHEQKNRIHHRQNPLDEIAAKFARKRRVLCLDEFVVTDITDAMILSALLGELFRRNVVLVTTSNTPPELLYRDGLQRARFLPAIELIKKHLRVVRVDGAIDYRMNYLASDSLYHAPHDENAMHALRRGFLRLEGRRAQSAPIELSGRAVNALGVGRGAAWFDFAELCQTNRSKLDYIEIARRFHSILLSDIPLLDASRDDAARRLIELIDELYDRGVNLIVSAAAPPAQLYRGVRLRESFARTASRLREMSSREYLARAHLH